jgi:uncharacterized membrane protein
MAWLGLALLAAFCESLKDLFSKKSLHFVEPKFAAWAASVLSFPVLLVSFFATEEVPQLGDAFLLALVCGGSLNILALIQFMKALQASDLSVTIPFISLTPLFLLITSPVLVGEFPQPPGLMGIVLIVVGSYILHLQEVRNGYLAPFHAIVKEKGPRHMLFVAVIYSITANIDKIGVLNSSPLFWSLSINAFMTIGLWVAIYSKEMRVISTWKSSFSSLSLIGLFQACTLIAHNFALSLGPVPSVIAVKRMSALFAVLWGYFILKEMNHRERLTGAFLMVMGVVLLGM